MEGAVLLIQYKMPEILWGKTLILWKKAGIYEKVMFFMCIMTDNCYWRQSDQAHGKAGKNKLFFRFFGVKLGSCGYNLLALHLYFGIRPGG